MRYVEHADFGLFVGNHRFHQLHAHFFERGAHVIFEIIFNHPLDKGFAHHRRLVGNTSLRLNARGQIFGRARHNAVDHGIGGGYVGFYPFDDVVLAG